jgi:hypothetical protein
MRQALMERATENADRFKPQEVAIPQNRNLASKRDF